MFLDTQDNVDGLELYEERLQRNAPPLMAIAFEEDIGRIGPAPFVLQKAEIRRRDDVGRSVHCMHGQQLEVCMAYIPAVLACPCDGLA